MPGWSPRRGAEPGRYSFDHALIRETLYEGMSRPRRALIHRHVGEALEAAGGEAEIGRAGPALHTRGRIPGRREGDRVWPGRRGSAPQRCSPTRRRPSTTRARSRCSTGFGGDNDPRRGELLLLQGEAQVRGRRARARLVRLLGGGRARGAPGRRRDRRPRRGCGLAPLPAAAGRGRHRTDRVAGARAGAHPRASHGHARAASGATVRGAVLLAAARRA